MTYFEKKWLESEKNCKFFQENYELYKEKYEQAAQAYDRLLFAFQQFQREKFGARSERFKDQSIAQMDLFSSVPAKAMDPVIDSAEIETDSSSNHPVKRKKRGNKNQDFDKWLPRREIIIPAENKKPDDVVIRYEVKEYLHYVPPVHEVIVEKREVVKSVDSQTGLVTLRTASQPKHFLKAGVTENFLANMIVNKIYDRQPLYHLEKKFSARFNFICPRNKMARWFIESSKVLQPLGNLLRDEVLDYDIASCDPTHIQVLNEPGRLATQKSYIYTIRGGPPEKMVAVFEYQPDEHKSFLENWFSGFAGYLQVDGQNIFDIFNQSQIKLSYCNAHARRKFEPIAKSATKPGLAMEAMKFYQKIYAIERAAKNAKMNSQERYQLRQEKTKPLWNQFIAWLEEKYPTTLPQSPLGKAFQYVIKRKAGLGLFLEDGRLEIDNNLTEQKNKQIALARKNFLFSHSVDGAHALCVHMTLIFTAMMHDLDPYHYYVHIMQSIPYCSSLSDYEALLPWNVHHLKIKKAA